MKRTESEFIFAKFFDAYDESRANTKPTLGLLGVYQFRKQGTTVDPRIPEQSASLVTSGVYQFSRNPMYVGMLLMLVGWGIYLGNIASFIMLPIFILYMNRFQIMPEETFMAEKFGRQPMITPGWVRKYNYEWRVSSEKAKKELGGHRQRCSTQRACRCLV